ncbi:MAG: hypothetical protein R2713_04610 [Ilumatobacteraceae bacterium]
MFALQPRLDGVLGHHLVDREVLPHVTQELEDRDRHRPVGVVDQRGLVRPGLEVEQLAELGLDALDVVAKGVHVEQVALLAASSRVAHHARGATGEWERPVTCELEATHEQLTDQVADVERVGRGIEADVEPDRSLGEPGAQGAEIGGTVDEATCLEVVDQIHRVHMLPADVVESAGIRRAATRL